MRPLTPTGTNLLGLVKHLAGVEAGYFGDIFGRPFAEPMPWMEDDAEPNEDLWATPEESREDIIGLYHRVWAHADATFDALPLDHVGEVPWWPEERRRVTLHRILVHVIAETNRHMRPRGHRAGAHRRLGGAAAGRRQPAAGRRGVVGGASRPGRTRGLGGLPGTGSVAAARPPSLIFDRRAVRGVIPYLSYDDAAVSFG